MTPAEELAAAAEKLRRTCAAAAPGPWTIAEVPPYTHPLLLSRFDETPDDEEVLIVGTVDLEPEDRAVVQLLHPGVGVAIASWLDSWTGIDLYEAGSLPEDAKHALAVARQINQSTP